MPQPASHATPGAATASMAQIDPETFDPCDGQTRHIVNE